MHHYTVTNTGESLNCETCGSICGLSAAGEDAVLGAGKGGGEVVWAGHAQPLWSGWRVHPEVGIALSCVAARSVHCLLPQHSASINSDLSPAKQFISVSLLKPATEGVSLLKSLLEIAKGLLSAFTARPVG